MKHLYTLIFIIISLLVQAQAPQEFKYQAILRDAEGNIKSNEEINVVVDILEGSADGSIIFSEMHSITTQANGLINLNIGSVSSLENIEWSTNNYFIQITIEDEILGVSQLLSVPYAIHANTADNFEGTITEDQISNLGNYLTTETDPNFSSWDKSSGIQISEGQISDLGDYVTTESDPSFNAWNKSSGITITESQITDLQTYLTTIENQSIANLSDVDLTGVEHSNVLKYDADLSKFVVAEAFGTTETDPVFSAWDKSSGISISESQISDFATYLISESDPVFSAWDKSTGITITENQISDFGSYLSTETDPDFNTWDKSSGITITESQITNLGAYLSSESDPAFSGWDKSSGITITESQISDLQAYLTSENDPVFQSSAANNISSAGSGSVITTTERTKLSNIEDGANVNVQADWSQSNTLSDDYIKNKPTAISSFALNANSQRITNVADPVNAQDVATKMYTDNLISGIDVNDADASPTNELQDLSLDGTNLLISNGQGVDLSGIIGGGSQTLEDVLTNGNSAGTNRITNLSPPQETMDAVTKGYVDALEDRITALELLQGIATLSDVDGNNYEYVQIGTQIWMAENLKVTHYADGTPINLITNSTTWSNLSDTDKAYCYYNNSAGTSYGALYTWAAASNGTHSSQNPSNVQGVCPDGWHLPSDEEWEQLRDYIGITGAGGKLKETGTTHWASPNTGATDEYGFTALPNGERSSNGAFENKGNNAFFWTSTQSSSSTGTGVFFVYNSSNFLWSSTSKNKGRAVRCVKD